MRFAHPFMLMLLLLLPVLLMVLRRQQRPAAIAYSSTHDLAALPPSFITRLRQALPFLRLLIVALGIIAGALLSRSERKDPDQPSDAATSTTIEFSAGWYGADVGTDTPDVLAVALDQPTYQIGDVAAPQELAQAGFGPMIADGFG